jgi:hypothetical protein
MPTSSPDTASIARNNLHALLRAHATVSNKAKALASGWSESWVSRFFGEKNADGTLDVEKLAKLLAEMKLKVYPAHWEVYDPDRIQILLGGFKLGAELVDHSDLKN